MPELPQVAHPKSQVPYVVIAGVAALAIGYLQWSLVNQTASRVVVPATALSIGLAWYSVLSLRETRGENWWHTGDRLLRATFVAVTLVFVVEIATKPAPTTPIRTEPPVTLSARVLAKDLNDLADSGRWTPTELQRVLSEHFASLKGDGRATLTTASKKSVDFAIAGDRIRVLSPQ